jgi:hypothetical protein
MFKKDKMFSKNVDTLLNKPTAVVKQLPDSNKIETIVAETEPIDLNKQPIIGYTSDKYYMVVGSFLSEKLALRYAHTILDMGYQPQVIYSSSLGYYRVSVKSYTDLNTALSEMPGFRSSITGRAWVHIKK